MTFCSPLPRGFTRFHETIHGRKPSDSCDIFPDERVEVAMLKLSSVWIVDLDHLEPNVSRRLKKKT